MHGRGSWTEKQAIEEATQRENQARIVSLRADINHLQQVAGGEELTQVKQAELDRLVADQNPSKPLDIRIKQEEQEAAPKHKNMEWLEAQNLLLVKAAQEAQEQLDKNRTQLNDTKKEFEEAQRLANELTLRKS